jgi:AcrR family transcriptional regulator
MSGDPATSPDAVAVPSARRAELLELAYRYAVEHGSADLSLRPLAKAVGSSPRVLLYLFGSKDGLIRALLARGRADEIALLDQVRGASESAGDGLAEATARIWSWLAADAHRALLTLWVDGYARSLAEPGGPWGGFAESTVTDWLAVLASAQPAARRDAPAAVAQRTLALAVLRGALLDVLATGDADRATAAVRLHLSALT